MSSKWILSATEIETFELCRRKWAFRYLDQIEIEPSAAAQLGSMVHKALENYLIDNTINTKTHEGQIASAGLLFLPKNLTKDKVEKCFLYKFDDHIFHGFMDFYDQVDSQTWLIGDHKTCSTFTTALSSHELKKNVQANIYAQWVFTEKQAESVQLNWIYYRTKSKPEARLVEATLTKEEAQQNFLPIKKAADEIKELVASKATSSELQKNEAACFKYGRCPFYAECKYGSKKAANGVHTITRSQENYSPVETTSHELRKSFHLFVDCAPTKTGTAYKQTIELSDLLKPVLTKIQQEKELSHYRLATYGQHVGLIAHYLSEYLKNNTYDSQTAILSSLKTPEGCDTLQTLTAAAGKVVRGFS